MWGLRSHAVSEWPVLSPGERLTFVAFSHDGMWLIYSLIPDVIFGVAMKKKIDQIGREFLLRILSLQGYFQSERYYEANHNELERKKCRNHES